MSKLKKDDDFKLVNDELPEACKDPEITQEDFKLAEVDGGIHEQKFQTKPTTFLKDSLRRFRKNKSSVVASYILGFLVLLAIFVPIFSPYDVSKAAPDTSFYNLEPKLFNDANGFWDGTSTKTGIPVDPNTMKPDPVIYKESGISDLDVSAARYTSTANSYAKRGYVQVGYYTGYDLNTASLESRNSNYESLGSDSFVLDLNNVQLTIKNFETVDANKIRDYWQEGDPVIKEGEELPLNFVLGFVELDFIYTDENLEENTIVLTPVAKVHNIGADPAKYEMTEEIDINAVIEDYFAARMETVPTFNNFRFAIRVTADEGETSSVCGLVKNLVIDAETLDTKVESYFSGKHVDENLYVPGISFTDANEFITREKNFKYNTESISCIGYWAAEDLIKYTRDVHLAICNYATFKYNSYEGEFGKRTMNLGVTVLNSYVKAGYIRYEIYADYDEHGDLYPAYFEFEFLNRDKCPIVSQEITVDNIVYIDVVQGETIFQIECDVMYYKYLGYDKMPTFLFGTDKTGRDMFKYVFEGLRNSLLLGVAVFAICFTIGLIYGAISGYFGGTVDLVMERITDILSGLPWIVVMTLVILKTNESSFGTFIFALCLTGWIGTASLTRTQFYRFRGREYVLASRTLGASHARLISRHILPNAMGTIITSSVLMIPAIIFQEATISYLGLGFKNLSSLGVILSNNQNELTNHPYQLIFPSVVIALVMISFNLFGNGLRDAINPSLKGEDE